MTQIILDATLRSKLHNLSQPLELCDESGRILARLTPVLDPSQYEPVEPQLSPDELQRRRQEPDFSTAEVLAYLEKL
ncbi:MAG TPA: hypothetical protein VH575_09935 [Gemmataceae bacterium]|jgi:hypothetical protein